MQLSLFERTTLEAVNAVGKTSGVYSHVSRSIGLTEHDMTERVQRGQFVVGRWQHKIRQVQQSLKSKGLIHNVERGEWALTETGKKELTYAPEKRAQVFFVTRHGISFWGDSSIAAELFPGEIELIVTSPPYLLTKARDYKNIGATEKEYVDGMTAALEQLLPCLTSTGSVVLNIGDSIKKGSGHQSLYKERLLIALEDKLGLHLVQKFVWFSPSKMPSGYWVTKAKRDCVQATEDFYWLSLNPKAKTNINQKVLVEYSDIQKRYMEAAQRKSPVAVRKKPSGQSANEETFYQAGNGAIPTNLLMATPEGANSPYSLYCKKHGLPRHPAMFNPDLPEFFIKYLTEPGDVVLDPYAGSGSTGKAAEDNGRHWVMFEQVREFVQGQVGCFQNQCLMEILYV